VLDDKDFVPGTGIHVSIKVYLIFLIHLHSRNVVFLILVWQRP
jgi:hypothetical protein